MKTTYLFIYMVLCVCISEAQTILPTPMHINPINSTFTFQQKILLAYANDCPETIKYLSDRLKNHIQLEVVESITGDIVLNLKKENLNLGNEGYTLKVANKQITISANSEAGLFYGIQSLLQLLPHEVQAGKEFELSGVTIDGLEIKDQPKYRWRSFMLDAGRQYQTLDFVKRYLDHMAMLKMNVFHWHLTEGQGWRIEIKKYPKLTEIGSKVAPGKEQQGYYTQQEIKEIVAYAKKLHIDVLPEIDVPGHAEAALIAYPEMTCFGEPPQNIYTYSTTLFCAGREDTYDFLEDIIDEVCQLFPSEYIHLGGDEALKPNWDKCQVCQQRIKEENLEDSNELQLYFSSRLAKYLKTKNKKAIFWGDVVCQEGTSLPDNVVVHWWNWRRNKDLALQNAIKRGHEVICNTNYYTYLNFPLSPWKNYKENRTFDIRSTYEQNPSDLSNPHELVLGMGSCLWTDGNVQEYMVDRRVFPRIFSLSEQMWSYGNRLPFEQFYEKVQSKYDLLELLGIDYGPALKEYIPIDYSWE